jgi:outer membrane protein
MKSWKISRSNRRLQLGLRGFVVGFALFTGGAAWSQTVPQNAELVVNDTTPAPAVLRLDLASSYRTAIDNSVVLSEYRSRVLENKARIQEALSIGRPNIGLDGAVDHNSPAVPNYSTSLSGTGSKYLVPPNEYSGNITIQQSIYTFGRLHWAAAQAELATKSAEEGYRQQAEQLFSDVATTYYDALLAQQNVTISQRQVEAQQAQLRDSQNLYKAGTLAKFDVLQSRAALSRTQQVLLASNNNVATSKDRLLTQLGLRVGTPVELTAVQPAPPPPADVDQATDQALKLRPDLGVVDWAWEAAKANVNVIAAQNHPSLSAVAQASQHTPTGFDPAFQTFAGILFSVPLYDGGLTNARRAEAIHVAEELGQQLEGARRNIRLEVRTVFNTLQNLWRQRVVAERTLEQAAEVLRVAIVRYRSGISTSVELLAAQSTFANAEYGLAQAEHDYLAQWANWHRAVSDEYPAYIPGPLLLPRAHAPATRDLPFPVTTDRVRFPSSTWKEPAPPDQKT